MTEKNNALAEDTMAEVDNAMPGEYVTDDDIPRYLPEPGHIKFTWTKHGIIIHVRHFNNLRCHAELEVWYYNQNTAHERLLLPTTHVDLLSASSKQAIVRQLRNDTFVLNWDWMLNCVAFKVIDISRQQEPIKEIVSKPDLSLEADYLLKPILYRGHPTVAFGDKGSTKSLLALVIAYIVQLPLVKNLLGLTTGQDEKPCNVLFLDYEDEESSFTKRWTAIQRGFRAVNDLPDGLELPILYKRMTARLADAVEVLRAEVIDRNIGLVIVDSLGPAARGKLNDPEPAIEYHAALRGLGVTSLTLAHNSKDPLTKTKSIFGSVFFTNLARSIWEVKAEQEPADNELVISLKQTNANLSGKQGTLGYKYTFSTDTISIATVDLRETSLSGELSLSSQIKNLLRNGALTLDKISTDLEVSRNIVKTTVYRLAEPKRGVLIKTGTNEDGIDKWGLKHNEG